GLEETLKREVLGLSKLKPGGPDPNDLFVSEIFSNSEIEGVVLDERGITESLLGNLASDSMKKEQAAVDLMRLGVKRAESPLSHDIVKELHAAIFQNEHGGKYMGGLLIVSAGGRIDRQVIVDRGVPPERVDDSMGEFIDWYNGRDQSTPLYNAVRGHLHFESIHPFHDGNGRVGRTLMNMGLMSDLDLKFPLAVSRAIRSHKETYYGQFGTGRLDLTETVKAFTPILVDAVKETIRLMDVTDLRQTAHKKGMNERQRNVFERLCRIEMTTGFVGNFTNEKYRKMAKISEEKMANRDLKDLVEKGILTKHGSQKGTHYKLAVGSDQERGSR
ncbi:MAG TPA: Fic family protein, partial [Luteolibacter sp.]